MNNLIIYTATHKASYQQTKQASVCGTAPASWLLQAVDRHAVEPDVFLKYLLIS